MYIFGDWRLIDTYWASCGILKSKAFDKVESYVPLDKNVEKGHNPESHIINDFYFLTDPDKLISTHLPDNPQWQLLPKSVSQEKFETTVYIRDKFFSLGLSDSCQTQTCCILETVDGLVEVGFSISESKASSASFVYSLSNLHDEFHFDSGLPADEYVLNHLPKNCFGYTLRFPKPGIYKFDIFGRENRNDLYDLVCSYIIKCETPKKNCSPLPVVPVAGWGPNAACRTLGFKPETHRAAVVRITDGVKDIEFSARKNIKVRWKISASGKDDYQFKNQVILWRDEDKLNFQTRLNHDGEYALQITASDVLGRSENVCNYLLDVISCSSSVFPLLRGKMLGPSDLADFFNVKPVNKEDPIIKTNSRD